MRSTRLLCFAILVFVVAAIENRVVRLRKVEKELGYSNPPNPVTRSIPLKNMGTQEAAFKELAEVQKKQPPPKDAEEMLVAKEMFGDSEGFRGELAWRARNGLFLVGASETRRIFIAAVALLANLTVEEYLHYQTLSRIGEGYGGDGRLSWCASEKLAGFTCSVSETGLHYVTADTHIHFFWLQDLKGDRLPKELELMSNYADPTLYVNVPLSHLLWHPFFPGNFLYSTMPVTVSSLTQQLSLNIDAFLNNLTQIATPLVKGSLALGLGHSYCSRASSDMLEHYNTSGELLHFFPDERVKELKERTAPGGCVTGDHVFEYIWTSPCDSFLQSNGGMKHANDILRQLVEKTPLLKLVDMYTLGEHRSTANEISWDECARTHWPMSVISDQLQAILATLAN